MAEFSQKLETRVMEQLVKRFMGWQNLVTGFTGLGSLLPLERKVS